MSRSTIILHRDRPDQPTIQTATNHFDVLIHHIISGQGRPLQLIINLLSLLAVHVPQQTIAPIMIFPRVVINLLRSASYGISPSYVVTPSTSSIQRVHVDVSVMRGNREALESEDDEQEESQDLLAESQELNLPESDDPTSWFQYSRCVSV
jgi:hypothetical protein